MIATLCLNPSFDRTVEVARLTPGAVNRVRASRMDAGGKGLNVARLVSGLGGNVRCLGAMGEENADSFQALMDAENLRHQFLRVPGRIRTNLKVVSGDGQPVTEINEPGPRMEKSTWESLMKAGRETSASWWALTGSLPPECPKDAYGQWAESVGPEKCVLDAEGEALLNGLRARPYLVKPNRDELQSLFGQTAESLAEVVALGRRLLDMGARNALVSLGGKGAVLIMDARVLYAPAIRVEARSTVGAGDAMVGGVLAALDAGKALPEALCWGVAAGAGSVRTSGTQMPTKADFLSLLGQATVQEVEVC